MSAAAHGSPGASGPAAGEAGALAWPWSRAAMDWGTRWPGLGTVSVPLVCVCVCSRGLSGGGGALAGIGFSSLGGGCSSQLGKAGVGGGC